jgi:hypothetical protein
MNFKWWRSPFFVLVMAIAVTEVVVIFWTGW